MTRASATTWIQRTLIDPETAAPFVLNRAERRFLKHAFELTPDGRLKHPELIYSAPKKSGKTGFGAMIVLYVVCELGGPYAEGIIVANDFEQAQSRGFAAVSRIAASSPLLADDATITANKIMFASTGSTIIVIASEAPGAAGSNANVVWIDELWGVTTERGHRLWDELSPPPTRKIAARLVTTYAGYEGESDLLESIYKRGIAGARIAPDLYEQPGMLCFWSNSFIAAWQTPEWDAEMRATMRPNAYARMIENKWVSSESSFVEMAWWDACADPAAHPLLADTRLPIWIGVDASVKRDYTAIVVVTWDDERHAVRLVTHRVFHPSPEEPLDFESTIEATILELARRFTIREVRFDPYQMQSVAQRLSAQRVPMVEFGQTSANLTAASTGLYELIKARNIVVYPDDDLRLAVQRSVAIETTRGWRIAKDKTSHKIDAVVALAMATYGAVQESTTGPVLIDRNDLILAAPAEPSEPLMPHKLGFVIGCVSWLWVTDDGQAASALFAQRLNIDPAPLELIDYQLCGWDAEMIETAVTQLDDACEAASEGNSRCRQNGVGAWFFVPESLLQLADETMLRVFEERGRFTRVDMQFRAGRTGVEAIPQNFIANRGRLALSSSAHVKRRLVKIGPAAARKGKIETILQSLSFRAGQRVDQDPLRLVLTLGIAHAFDPAPSNIAPPIPAARMTTFG